MKTFNPANPVHAWKLRKALVPYGTWWLGETLARKWRTELGPMPDDAARARRVRHSRPAVAAAGDQRRDAQAPAQAGRPPVPDVRAFQPRAEAGRDAGTSLYAAKQNDEVVRLAADVLCQDLTRELTGQRPERPLLPGDDDLGEKIADGDFASHRRPVPGRDPDEVRGVGRAGQPVTCTRESLDAAPAPAQNAPSASEFAPQDPPDVPTFAVILPAAGKSSRFRDQHYKKPFVPLEDRPVWLHAAEKFANRSDVKQTLLVISPEDREAFQAKMGANVAMLGIEVVEGGQERYDSVAAALARVQPEIDYVAVHDAARPCLADEWIDAVFAAATKTGAAILATPISGTLKRAGKDQMRARDRFARRAVGSPNAPGLPPATADRRLCPPRPAAGHRRCPARRAAGAPGRRSFPARP